MRALQSDNKVWENFQKFLPQYQRMRIDTIQIKKYQPRVFNARLAKFIRKHKKMYNVRRMEQQRQVVLCRCFLICFIVSDCIVGFFDIIISNRYIAQQQKHLNNSSLPLSLLSHNQRVLYFLYRDLHWFDRSFLYPIFYFLW